MEVYGLAMTSPDLYSPGLLGTQGWSPSSSVYSDDCEDDSMMMKNAPNRKSIDFPLPPLRQQMTRPLSLIQPRAVSARVLEQSKSMDAAWEYNEETEANLGLEGLGITSPGKMSKKDRSLHLHMPNLHRRTFSAPALPPAYLDIINGDDSPEVEPEEYPFPVMPAPRYYHHNGDSNLQDEKAKLRRLQASLDLLHSEDRKSRHEEDQSASPLQRMSFKAHFLSPEHRAPSLAEQMAYACGLGNQCAWSSPHKMARSSSDIYQPTATQEIATNAQEERKMASRHIRQVVAATGAAPMSRSVSLQSAFVGEVAEVGSSWSHKGHGEDSDDEDDNDSQYWLRSSTPMDRRFSQHSLAASTVVSVNSSPILHGTLSAADFDYHHRNHLSSHFSSDSECESPSTCATSELSHLASSKHGKASSWNAVDVDCLFVKGLALQGEETYSRSSTPSSCNSSEAVTTPVDSPNSLHEFSYIIDSEQFNNFTTTSPSKCSANVFGDDGFNGNTFSPIIKTPDLDAFPPAPIGFAASPTLDQSSIEPHSSVISDHGSQFAPEMARCNSTLSVLERPRPFSRSVTSSFFGSMDVKIDQSHQLTNSKSATSIKKLNETRRPSTVEPLIEIPSRSSSLEVAPSAVSCSHNSVQAFYEESNRDLVKAKRKIGPSVSFADLPMPRVKVAAEAAVPIPAKVVAPAKKRPTSILITSSKSEGSLMSSSASNQRLSPKALAQVREACRAKADFVRNTALEKAEAEEEAAAAAAAAAAKKKRQQFASTPRQPALLRHGNSEPIDVKAASAAHHEKKQQQQQKKEKMTTKGAMHKRSAAEHQGVSAPKLSPSSSSFSVPDSTKVPLPTLFVARSESQRKKGITGIPATEPHTLALANLGIRTDVATRESKVEALIHKPDALYEGGMLKDMPNGVILVVETKYVNESHVIVA